MEEYQNYLVPGSRVWAVKKNKALGILTNILTFTLLFIMLIIIYVTEDESILIPGILLCLGGIFVLAIVTITTQQSTVFDYIEENGVIYQLFKNAGAGQKAGGFAGGALGSLIGSAVDKSDTKKNEPMFRGTGVVGIARNNKAGVNRVVKAELLSENSRGYRIAMTTAQLNPDGTYRAERRKKVLVSKKYPYVENLVTALSYIQ